MKGLSWSKPENLHVTVKFLGDTDRETETRLIDSLSRIAASFTPFRLRLAKPEILGKRVISIAVDSDPPTVFSLEKAIDTACERLGFEREGRRFHPHLTIARIRRPEGTTELTRHFLKAQIEPLGFEVREIVLYESELGAGGSVYNEIERFSLKG